MIPIIQKITKNDFENGIYGDCLRASMCSLIEISDEGIPNFVESGTIQPFKDWLADNGYTVKYTKDESEVKEEYYLAWGVSSRGNNHSVVYRNGKLAHDPYPNGDGVTNIKWFVEITK